MSGMSSIAYSCQYLLKYTFDELFFFAGLATDFSITPPMSYSFFVAFFDKIDYKILLSDIVLLGLFSTLQKLPSYVISALNVKHILLRSIKCVRI